MAASERVDLRFTLITAGVLLALLVGIWGWQRLARPEKVLIDEALQMPRWPASRQSGHPDDFEDNFEDEEEADEAAEERALAIRFTPELHIDGPTTLHIELEREPVEGWVGLAVALIHRQSGEVRELALSSVYRRGPEGRPKGDLRVDALVDRVEDGGWVARLEPAWEPLADPLPGRQSASAAPVEPPAVRVRITQGRRTPWQLWLAAGLVLLPAVVQIGRRLWYTRRSKTGRE